MYILVYLTSSLTYAMMAYVGIRLHILITCIIKLVAGIFMLSIVLKLYSTVPLHVQ